ncbi:prolyl 3-hydroxylase OGFOD1-like isoform X2 [Ostrea edulis]|uniref:prolyl 3-hydroxylase OGFOD1-like isoform X2 n=1 Tax=Ostrea edulis TaxID=37623 RepID=UPI0024AF84F1|nr:prolyl 3-hydroxylase OGFOD1-like isoform X2 [Ostrea edulis]
MSGKRKSNKLEAVVTPKKTKIKGQCNVDTNKTFADKQALQKLRNFVQGDLENVDICDVGDIQAYKKPFFHCVMSNLVQSKEFIENLQDEILDLSFVEKNNDLYKFHQSTEDLKITKLPYLSALRDVIYDDIRGLIMEVTAVDLTTQVDMSCAIYKHTDVLSCHDDELDDRRVAFIYYLVPPSWREEDGGRLQMFSLHENGEPNEIVKSIIPVRNSFVFFEVTPASFHQVEEILTEDKTRLSISGWFHGPRVDRPTPHVETLPAPCPPVSIEEEDFYSWINPQYLDTVTQASIKDTFVEESQIELNNFLQENIHDELVSLLSSIDKTKWRSKGPPNKRNYMSLDLKELPDHVMKCLNFLQSDAMFLMLSSLTGLKLHDLAEVSDSEGEEEEGNNTLRDTPGCHCEVRKWQHGCYTLVHDTDTETKLCALDAVLYIGCEGWDTECGGITSYIAKGEDEELLSVCPSPNSLALVYRDTETLKFVKHINSRVKDTPNRGFIDIACVYYE